MKYLIAAAVLIVLIAVIVVVVILLRRRRAAAAARANVDPKVDPGPAIRAAFAKTEKSVRQRKPNAAERDGIPRVLVIGEPGSGKTTLLRATNLNTPLDKSEDPMPGDRAPVHIWTFDQAIVVDPRGDLSLTDKGEEPDPPTGLDALVDAMKGWLPARPVDAIVLTIPCTDLDPRGASTDEDRKRKATTLHKQVGDIQRKLAMRVPVYVLVTKCDVLPSFQAFTKEVDPGQRQGILGWSRPDPDGPIAAARADDVFTHDFVGKAVEGIEQQLLARQVARFLAGPRRSADPGNPSPRAESARIGAADGLFLFPTELNMIAGALRVYVDEIFVPSVYDEPFDLRGIYFCGDSGDPPVAAPSAVAASSAAGSAVDPRGVLFVRKLFADKIVPETSLARPSGGAERGRRRLILGLQLAAVIAGLFFGVALTLEAERLRSETASLRPCLLDIQAALDRQRDPGAPAATPTERGNYAIDLLEHFALIQTERLVSLFIPASWLRITGGSVDARIQSAIRLGYERVILDAFRVWLDSKAQEITSPEQGSYPMFLPATSLESSSEFVALNTWLLQVSQFDDEVRRYNRLMTSAKGTGDHGELTRGEERRESESRLADVAELADYLLHYKAEPSFYTDSRYYRQSLAHGVDLSKLQIDDQTRQLAEQKDTRLFRALFEVLYLHKDQIVREDLEGLKGGLDKLMAGGPDYSVKDLRGLRRAIGITELDLGEPELGWVPQKVPPDSQGLRRLLELVERSTSLLGPDKRAALELEDLRRREVLLAAIEGASAELTGPLVMRKGKSTLQMALSDSVLSIKKPVDEMLAEDFMAYHDEDKIRPAPPEDHLRWDGELLKEAGGLVKAHEAFEEGAHFKQIHGATPDGTLLAQTALLDLGRRQLRTGLADRVTRAMQHEPAQRSRGAPLADRTRVDVDNIRQAATPLRDVLGVFIRYGDDQNRDVLRKIIKTQGFGVLADAYAVLRAERLYTVRGGSFSWWESGTTPAYDAFGVNDAAGLAEFVAGERAAADSTEKDYAEPVLALLESFEVGADLGDKELRAWRDVVTPLREYEQKKPGNGVSLLDQFLQAELPAITLDNCLTKVAAARDRARSARARDFFTAKKAVILQQLATRCDERSRETIGAKYFDLWREFNTQLAGRFPFAKADPTTRVEDAPPEAVQDFLKKEADFTRVYHEELVRRGEMDETSRNVVRFLDDMEKVRAFLEPMWAQVESAADGAFDVRVEFRANAAHEVGGNQIAEWLMLFPEERLSLGGPKSAARWRIGDDVRIALRWAKNSPDVPTTQQDYGAVARDRLVTFEADGTWALLRLIAYYQTAVRDAAGAVDASADYLMLKVEVMPDPAGGFLDRVRIDSGATQVFLRLVLSGAAKKALPKYPVFPDHAPAL